MVELMGVAKALRRLAEQMEAEAVVETIFGPREDYGSYIGVLERTVEYLKGNA